MDDVRDDIVIRSFRRWGLLLIAVPAVVVAVVVGLSVRNTVIRGYGDLVAAGINTLVAQSYSADNLAVDTDSPSHAKLGGLVGVRVDERKLVRVEMFLADGSRFFSSSQRSSETESNPMTEEARRALQGAVSTSVIPASEVLGEDGGSAKLLQVVGPVTLWGSPEPVGWLVGYRPYSAVSASVQDAVTTVVVTVLLGAALAYGIQWWLVRSAARALEKSRDQERRMNDRLGVSMSDLERHSLGTLQALAAAVDAKDSYTARHSVSVADIACALARRLGMGEELGSIERAGLLHDIGKIGVAESILQKTDLLLAEEYLEIQEHSRIGANIVETIPFLHDAVPAVLYHHERWDGRGYPDGLQGEEIPRVARVLAVADAFDAMTSDRPYREGMSYDKAVKELEENSGSQFDPEVAEALIELVRSEVVGPSRRKAASGG